MVIATSLKTTASWTTAKRKEEWWHWQLAASGTCIVIRGHHHDLVFRRNTIGASKPTPAGVGIHSDKSVRGLKAVDNQFLNVKSAMQVEER